MYSRFCYVLSHASHHHSRSIAESIHSAFKGVRQIAVDQNGAIPRHLHGRGDIVIELAFAVDDFHRPAAKHIGWANEHGITDAIGYRYGFLPAASDTKIGRAHV